MSARLPHARPRSPEPLLAPWASCAAPYNASAYAPGSAASRACPAAACRHPPPPLLLRSECRPPAPAPPACSLRPQDKSKDKQKQKLVEDKTFGLKNKGKSAKVQKYVEQLQKSAQPVKNPRLAEPSIKVAGCCVLGAELSVPSIWWHGRRGVAQEGWWLGGCGRRRGRRR